jgi:NAD+ synthase/NAD+ synthase (glutamine-hydrolysing)
MRIALAQTNPVIGDFTGNTEKIRSHAVRARDMGADLAVFPELAGCGYPPRDLLERRGFLAACRRQVEELAASVSGIGVLTGFVDTDGDRLKNGAVLFENGQTLFVAHKRLLPTYDVFDESRYFAPGDLAEVFPYKGNTLGVAICEDTWNIPEFFPRRRYSWNPVEALVKNGADLLINISASPFHAGKRLLRQGLMACIAGRHRVPAVYVNQTGGNDSLLFDGASTAHGPDGFLRARAREFAEDLVLFDTKTLQGDIHPVAETMEQAVLDALVMGVRDYFSKCGFQSAVLGLSGGIDSALVAAIAARALGPENVTALFMPSRFTSGDNFTDTRLLAERLGIRFETVPIHRVLDAYIQELGGSLETPGLMEQNLQARIRGNLLMARSNRYGSLVLSTGNKSELAVGYSTLYGDMCGGLAVISDLPKAMVYAVSRQINAETEIIPARILEKAPSAELKPNQKDQDDLPPYEVLDPILEAYVEEGLSLSEIAARGFDIKVVADVLRRVRLAEYKRRQAAPGLRITPKAFGEGRRYPVAHRWREEG